MALPGRTVQHTMILATCNILIDKEGAWFHEGNEITRREILEHFMTNLRRTEDGGYIVQVGANTCPVQVADTPFVIGRVDLLRSPSSGEEELLLSIRNLSRPQPLNPATLRVGEDHVMYCEVCDGAFPARFSRPAYYQLAEWIMEDPDTGQFYLELDENRYPIS